VSARLAALARRLADDTFFLASALREYQTSEILDEEGLAAMLGCSVETLVPLALCRRPTSTPPAFRRDVDRIAERFGVNAGALAALVRRADALAGLRQRATAERGTLLAARDREDETTDETDAEGPS
jgi:hypothetical protein